MKTNAKKIVALFLCAVILVAGTALTTVAYLTSQDEVTNTFTVGKVNIKLDEADVDEYGELLYKVAEEGKDPELADRVKANTYKLVPGVTYVKDPTVTVLAGSEESYIRMIVTVSNIDKLEAAIPQNDESGAIADNAKFYGEDGLFLLQYLCVDEKGNCTWDPSKWYVAAGYDNGTYEFRYHTTVSTVGKVDQKLEALFTEFTIPGTVTEEQLPNLDGVTLKVEAHAIQSAGFVADTENGKTAEDVAWEAFDDQRATYPAE